MYTSTNKEYFCGGLIPALCDHLSIAATFCVSLERSLWAGLTVQYLHRRARRVKFVMDGISTTGPSSSSYSTTVHHMDFFYSTPFHFLKLGTRSRFTAFKNMFGKDSPGSLKNTAKIHIGLYKIRQRFILSRFFLGEDSASKRRRLLDEPWTGSGQDYHWRLH